MPIVDDTLILCYHAVSPTWPSELAVEPAALRRQISALLADGYRAVRFSDAVRGDLRGRVLAITFDDAYDSVFDHALPILNELGVPATLFVPTDFAGTDTRFPLPGGAWIGTAHEDELLLMSWDRIRALRDAGWEIGSHTCSHPWLTQVPAAQLTDELERSAAICAEQLGEPCTSIAYPYGDHDDAVVAATAAAGYTTACTVPYRFDPFETAALRYGRIDVTRTESEWRFRVRTASASRRARATAAVDVGRWLDARRLRRSTVLAALASVRDRVALARALRADCEDWRSALRRVASGRPLRGLRFRNGMVLRFADPAADNLSRFDRIFVSEVYAKQSPIQSGEVVLDLGAADGLFAAYALERGAARVVCVEADPRLSTVLGDNIAGSGLDRVAMVADPRPGGSWLARMLDLAELESVDLCRLSTPDSVEVVAGADVETLARVGRLVLDYDPTRTTLRLDELVTGLEAAGFACALDIDTASGVGVIGATR